MLYRKPILIETETPKYKVSYDLLEKENLDRIGISREDIKDAIPVFHVPGYLYEENGLAGKNHQLLGSACTSICTYDERKFSIDDLWYFDENKGKTHFGGKPHWNHERRWVNHSNDKSEIIDYEKHAEPHSIEESPYMDISLTDMENGKKSSKRVYRP